MKAGKITNHRYSIADMGISLGNEGNSRRAIEMLDSIYRLSRCEPTDSGLMAYCLKALLPLYYSYGQKGEFAECVTQLNDLQHFSPHDASFHLYCAMDALDGQDWGKAQQCLILADSLATNSADRALLYYVLKKYNIEKGNLKEALACSEKALELQASALTDILRHSSLTAQNDFYKSKRENERKKAETIRIYLILSVIFFTVVLALGIMLYRKSRKASMLEKARLTERIHDLSECLTDSDRKMKALSESVLAKDRELGAKGNEVTGLFKETWSTLNMLSREIVEKGDSAALRPSIVTTIEKEIKKLRSRKCLREIEQSVNRYEDNIMDRLRSQCPQIKEEDMTLATLTYAGLDYKAISLILDIRPKYYYNRRDRLVAQIERSDAPDKDFFIGMMKK